MLDTRFAAFERGESASLRAALAALIARLGGQGAGDAPHRLPLGPMLEGMAPMPAPAETEADAREARRARRRAAEQRLLRANARAAYRSVQTGGAEAALDAALAVVEAELHAARQRSDTYAEALKTVLLYASEAEIRTLAGAALEARPCCLRALRLEPGGGHD